MATGMTLSGRYELRTRLGAGGAGAVWRGFDVTLQREVAIKLIDLDGPGLGVDIDAPISRFRREARAVAQLNHPNIVAAYDFGVHDDVAFLVMELVEGASLAEHLRRRRAAGLGGFDETQVIHIARQVCAGLAVAHRARLVHRDMKPSNLMVADANGRVKIVDFGIAHIEEQSRLTRTGSYLGTLPYVAPEQMDAEPIDGRADLYSLACVLFELMTGRSPYDASTPMQWMSAHQKAAPAPLRRYAPAASADMEALLLRMLSKNPNYRPPHADAVSEALAQVGARLALRAPAPLRYGQPSAPVPMAGSRGAARPPRASGAPPPAPPARFPARPPHSDPPPRPPGLAAPPGGLPVRSPGARLAVDGPATPPTGRPDGPGDIPPAVIGRVSVSGPPSPAGPPVDVPPGSRRAAVPPTDPPVDVPPGPTPAAVTPAGAGVDDPPAEPPDPVSPAAAREGARSGPHSAPDGDDSADGSAESADHRSADHRSTKQPTTLIVIPSQSPPRDDMAPSATDAARAPGGYAGAAAVFTGSAPMAPAGSAAHANATGTSAAGVGRSSGTVIVGALQADPSGEVGNGTDAQERLEPDPSGDAGNEIEAQERLRSDPSGGAASGTGAQDRAESSGGVGAEDPARPKATGSAARPTAPRPTTARTAAPSARLGSTVGHDGPGDIDVAADVAGPTVPLLRSKTQGNAVPRPAAPGRPGTGAARHSRPTAPVPPAVPVAPTMRRGQRPSGPVAIAGLPAVIGGGPAPTRARRVGQNIVIVAAIVAAIVLVATGVAVLSHPRRHGRQAVPPVPAVPAVGDCYADGWAAAIDPDAASVWSVSGNTGPVRCGDTHEFEVVASGTLSDAAPPAATSEAVREEYAKCARAADGYLGGPWRGAYAWLGVAVPDAAAWVRGARWTACLLRPTANWQGVGISAAGSLKDGLRGAKPAAITCFQASSGRPTSCDAPHSDEVVGLSTLPPGRWPGTQALYGAYGDSCQAIAARFLGFQTVKAWTSNALGWQWSNLSQEQWELGNRAAVCTVNTVREGGMTGSVRNLRNGTPK